MCLPAALPMAIAQPLISRAFDRRYPAASADGDQAARSDAAALMARVDAARRAGRLDHQAMVEQARLRAQQGAAGVDPGSGSALAVGQAAARDSAAAAADALAGGEGEAQPLLWQAGDLRLRARRARTLERVQPATDLLRVASSWFM